MRRLGSSVCHSRPGSVLALHQKSETDGAFTLQFYTFPSVLEMFEVKKNKALRRL